MRLGGSMQLGRPAAAMLTVAIFAAACGTGERPGSANSPADAASTAPATPACYEPNAGPLENATDLPVPDPIEVQGDADRVRLLTAVRSPWSIDQASELVEDEALEQLQFKFDDAWALGGPKMSGYGGDDDYMVATSEIMYRSLAAQARLVSTATDWPDSEVASEAIGDLRGAEVSELQSAINSGDSTALAKRLLRPYFVSVYGSEDLYLSAAAANGTGREVVDQSMLVGRAYEPEEAEMRGYLDALENWRTEWADREGSCPAPSGGLKSVDEMLDSITRATVVKAVYPSSLEYSGFDLPGIVGKQYVYLGIALDRGPEGTWGAAGWLVSSPLGGAQLMVENWYQLGS